MGEVRNVAILTSDVQANINRSVIEFRASWVVLTHDELKKDGIDPGPAIRRVTWKYGKIRDENYKATCASPDDCRDFTSAFLNELGRKTSEREVIEMKKLEVLVDLHYYPLLTAWKKLDFDDETCVLFCGIAIDGSCGIAEGMGLQLDLTEALAEGCSICKLRFYR